MDCEWIPFPIVPPGVVPPFSPLSGVIPDHVCRRSIQDDPRDGAWVVSIAALLDERRLSSMAAHPSAASEWYWSPQPIDDPIFDEEFPEQGDEF